MMSYTFLISHFASVTFILVTEYNPNKDNWYVKNNICLTEICDNKVEIYVNALYYSLISLSACGVCDISPANLAEKLYSIILIILGSACYAYLTS